MEKRIYLTFDDGPDEYTKEILDLLKKHNIKATFFNLGVQDEKYPETVKRLVREGHSLGNHTYFHNPDLYKNLDQFIDEVRKTHELQEKIAGKELPKIFRFPFGSEKAPEEFIEAIEEEGYQYYDWDVYLQDGSRNPSPEKAYQFAVEGVQEFKGDPIILTHCERLEKTGPRAALEKIITELKDQGYRFEVLK